MQELNMMEVVVVSGGEAGVPHDNYYYGPYFFTDPISNAVDSFLDWLESAIEAK